MAYLVSEQTRDIGIRMALGAPRENVLGMIFRRGMMTAAAGLAAGLAAAYALARLMASLVWGVTSTDPATFLGIAVALGAAAALAIYIPARRAMLIDPIVALRYE
jgi:ABC-type antimicrobial peptide transport system permease subunit